MFTSDATEKGLSIPVSALTASAKEAKVFVIKGNLVEQRAIKTGLITASKVQVLDGLKAGEQVVISGQLNLENGSPVSINK
jgi:multidrug efflux pump subunit AcrA (membrane-fusion protein)